MRRYARIAFAWLSWVFVACLVVQVFLAGVGAFGSTAGFEPHVTWAYTFGYLVLVNLVLAIAAGFARRFVALSGLLLVLFALQSVLAALRETSVYLAALHPVNGFLILLIAIVVARDAWPLRSTLPEASAAVASETRAS